MAMRLIVVEGPDSGRVFNLKSDEKFVIGRGEASDTQINDETMSRRHCELEIQGGEAELVDIGSAGGTFVNGQKIETSVIRPGAIIEAGSTRLRLEVAVDAGASTLAGAVPKPAAAQRTTDLTGKTLGTFELKEIIGKGVSGIVYKAWDSENQRDAAVKVLTPDASGDDDQKQRFVRAMKTMFPIKDPHIVPLYNAGKAGPFCWAAMAYVEGENLADLIDKIGIDGMLDWKEVWRVAMHISRALRVAYDQKIIHRNVTPTNILRRSSDRACLLGDFMLAKALEGKNAKQITQPGQLIGDLPYMSPERTKSAEQVDTRSDIYGLGATCYALLTGKAPASGDTLPEIVMNIRESEPPKPKTVQLSIDELFQDIVMKMIAKDPGDRFESPQSLIMELERIGKFNNLQADWSNWVG